MRVCVALPRPASAISACWSAWMLYWLTWAGVHVGGDAVAKSVAV
ncbi:MAG: hypothetical protein R3F60_08410 [bacterium]